MDRSCTGYSPIPTAATQSRLDDELSLTLPGLVVKVSRHRRDSAGQALGFARWSKRRLGISSLYASLAEDATVFQPLPDRSDEVAKSFADFVRRVDEMLPVGTALLGPVPYGRLARAVTSLAPATSCRIALRRVDHGLALRAIAGHRLRPPIQPKTMTMDELAVCLFALQTGRPVELRRGESMWLSDDQWPMLFTPGARAGTIVPFVFGPSGEGLLLLGDERHAARQPAGLTDRLELLGRRIGQILDLATVARTERRLDRKRQRHLIALERIRERREIAAAERRRLARELHDGVGPRLNQAIMHLRGLRREGRASAEGLRLVEEIAKSALEATRRLAYGIRMSAAQDDPLADARLYAGNILSLADCSLRWIDDRTDRNLPLTVAQELAHVIRESVTNAVKYSDAGSLTVRLSEMDATLSVSISDDGRGFVPMSVTIDPDGRGLGLLGNRERIAELGGTFSLVSVPDGGTIVRADVPLQRPFETLKEASPN